jgi:hypothetical protein
MVRIISMPSFTVVVQDCFSTTDPRQPSSCFPVQSNQAISGKLAKNATAGVQMGSIALSPPSVEDIFQGCSPPPIEPTPVACFAQMSETLLFSSTVTYGF